MNEYVELVRETLEPFGAVRARRMFGGYGLYHQDLMFGLVADGILYLKADEESVSWFRDAGLSPFQYMKKGRPVRLSYFAAPEEIFEDADAAVLWASRAWEAAVRAGGRSRARRARRRGTGDPSVPSKPSAAGARK